MLEVNCPHCNSEIGWIVALISDKNPPPQSGQTFTCDECKHVSRFVWSKTNHTKLALRPLKANEWFWLSDIVKGKIFEVGGLMPEGATWISPWTPPQERICRISVKPDVYEWLKDVDFNAVPKRQPDPKGWQKWQEDRRAEQWKRAELAEARRVYGELKDLLRTKRRGHKANTAVVEGERDEQGKRTG